MEHELLEWSNETTDSESLKAGAYFLICNLGWICEERTNPMSLSAPLKWSADHILIFVVIAYVHLKTDLILIVFNFNDIRISDWGLSIL